MNHTPLGALLHHLRGQAALQRFRDCSDAELLRAFADDRAQDAFTVIVRRHGAMVSSVCRRVLGHHQDAEDAFQATFLFLTRKSGSIRKQASLASWLHGVAYRMAHDARRSAARRRRHEQKAAAAEPVNPEREAAWREMQMLLDEEIQRLPERYRTAFILCTLEGYSPAEAASRLGVKEGTVRSSLSRARALLHKRLARRGVDLSLVLAAVSVSSAPAAVLPGSLVAATVEAAALYAANGTTTAASVAALVQGVNQAMLIGKLKIAAFLVLAVGSASAGVGGVTYQRTVALASEDAAQAPALGVGITDRVASAHGLVEAEPAAEEQGKRKAAVTKLLPGVGKKVEAYLGGSLKEIEGMDDWSPKVRLLLHLAELQIRFGDRPAALATCAKAAAVADAMKDRAVAAPVPAPAVNGPPRKLGREHKFSRYYCDSELGGIVPVQAAAGDVEGAIKIGQDLIVDEEDKTNLRGPAMQATASRLAREGRVADAQRVASRMKDQENRDVALIGIALAQANQGDFPGALQTAKAIQNARSRVLCLAGNLNLRSHFASWVGIAAIRAEKGDARGARETLDEAKKISETLSDPDHRGAAAAMVATGQARIGMAAAALQTAEKIADESNRKKALVSIAVVLADQKRCDEAFEILKPVDDPERSHALEEIALRQAKSGDKKAALATFSRAVKEIRNLKDRSNQNYYFHYLHHVARYQAEAGFFSDAMTTAELIQRPQADFTWSLTLRFIAASQARQGDTVGALKIYESLPKEYWGQSEMELIMIITSAVAIGKETDAQKLAERPSEPWLTRQMKSYSALGIAEGIMKRSESQADLHATKRDADALSPLELQDQWNALGGGDAAQAYQAVLTLRSAPLSAVRLLKERLRPATAASPADPQQLARLIANLDNKSFFVREEATEALKRLGDKARSALENVMKDSSSAEAHRRAEGLLQQMTIPVLSPSVQRELRAVEILANIGTREARELLQGLAKGAADADLTQAARAALARSSVGPGRQP